MYVTGILNYHGNYDSGQVATKQKKDVHNAFLLTYEVESFALSLETNCIFLIHFRLSDNVVPIEPGCYE